jgi:hypothetical protein
LQTNATLTQARRELSLRYGHLAAGRPANLDRFFDLYSDWLVHEGLEHTPANFRRYVEHGYCPGECLAQIEPIDWPTRIRHDAPSALRIRCQNRSVETWHLRPGLNAGVHATMSVYDSGGHLVSSGTAGLFEGEVDPGQGVDLVLALAPLNRAGRYQVVIDLGDLRHCWFYQAGSEPLEQDIVVE